MEQCKEWCKDMNVKMDVRMKMEYKEWCKDKDENEI